MQIHGFQKTTLLDYPGHLAATIFLGKCNFRCPFCHNSQLVLNPDSVETISQEEILKILTKRQGILEGVCITGGEPTLNPELSELIRKIKELDYKVKLDSNGYRPEILEDLLEQQLLDYIAMDIKSGPSGYSLAAGFPGLDIKRIEESVKIIMEKSPDYEFRTTLVKGIHTDNDIREIGQWLAGDSRYYLQNYQEGPGVIKPVYDSFTENELKTFKEMLLPMIPNVHIRGDYE